MSQKAMNVLVLNVSLCECIGHHTSCKGSLSWGYQQCSGS